MWRSHAKRPFLDYKASLKRETTFNIWRPLDDVNGYNIKWIFFFFFFAFSGEFLLALSLWVVILLHVDTSHLLVVPRRRECLYTNGMEGRTIFLFFSIQEDPIHRDWLLTTLQLAFFSSSSRSIHLLVFFFFLFLGFLFEHLNLDAGPLLLYTLLLLELFSYCCVFCSIGVAKGRERDTGPCHYITWAPYHIQDLSIRICLGVFFLLLLSWRVHIENHKPVVFITDWNGKILERHVRVAVVLQITWKCVINFDPLVSSTHKKNKLSICCPFVLNAIYWLS